MKNSKSISDLHQCLQRGAKELLKSCKKNGYDILITSTYRDCESQDALYSKGRTSPGKIVTYARAGQSTHNYKLAFDICKNLVGHEYSDNNFFQYIGKKWKDMGGVWGGDWKSPDKPHFEFTGGLTWKQLKNGQNLHAFATMKWEENSEKRKGISMRYNNLADLPAWSKVTIKKLIDKKYISQLDGNLNLDEDMLRLLVINDRSGAYN